ncbi:tripartite tricarboxylate transporter permease [Thalassobacter stenotrophicus]|uniref:Tripartite tricarboxylate transporter TctA family protein n=2 Tax=Thalassobacter stenotrophicus TaxID=266809 RepID=A0A0P1EYR5_9RHOB|nr:tripartite tricarboxylate transporter permease [Thalassobacter stenotrophicus]PVZ47289.1 C4-dicarboxylate ABC transporter permease [Thalassobacter stenotrophicus]CUH60143.1 Tripartite tricarboxylate transporter TctA family protein [Thalassobacter stenotrophicus]SHJ19391.1 putative tricarboxylic transport membrane protein [Thalassobacter stenotrophicus DSM 16310]
MEPLIAGLLALMDPQLLVLLFAATLAGVIIGSLPGLNATTGAALLLPFTITMEPIPAIAILTTIYCAATFAGAITAILINTPGTSASATTCLDGFPMAQRGEAGRALGMATVSSTIGGIISVFCLMLAAPLLARMAYNFAPPEYFALTVFGISMLATIGDGTPLKNIIAGCIGILLATVGKDLLTTVERFTFGFNELSEGIGFVPVMIGIFGISELLVQAERLSVERRQILLKAIKLPSRADYRKVWKTILRSSGIGTFIGILPAEGATVASMIGYNEARRWSKTPEEFGKGAIEGIAGSEAANNSATGGAMVPTLALGIPGSPTAAVILAGLMVHGLQPGPTMFTEQAEFAYAIFWSMLLVNITFIFVGLFGAKLFARVTFVPVQILWPIVFTFSIVGAYALDQSMLDVYIAIGSGVIGYFMRRFGYSVVPLAIGLILGGMLEKRLGQSLIMLDDQWWLMFTRPLTLLFFVLTVLALFGPYCWCLFRQRDPLQSTGE